MFTPTGCVNEVIYPKSLEPRFIVTRNAEKKRLRYDCQDEAPFTIWNLQCGLIRRLFAVLRPLAGMDEEAMVCCSKNVRDTRFVDAYNLPTVAHNLATQVTT